METQLYRNISVKSRSGESGNWMKGMLGIWGIRVEMMGIRGIGDGNKGNQGENLHIRMKMMNVKWGGWEKWKEMCAFIKILFWYFGMSRELEDRRMGIAANSSANFNLVTFCLKNLKNSRCANLLANRMSYLLFIRSQSKADM